MILRAINSRRRRQVVVTYLALVPPILILAIVVLAIVLPVGSPPPTGRVTEATLASLLVFAMITGVMSMAIIETVKRLTRVRSRYQIYQIHHWLDGQDGSPQELAFQELVRAFGLPSGSMMTQLFDLPIEQLSAQISAAADLALAFPERSRFLLAALARVPHSTIAEIPFSEGRVDSRAIELTHQVRTGLNMLQINVGQGWTRQLRLTGCWLSGLIGLLVSVFGYIPPGLSREYVLAALLVGGFFAWLARDLSALIERLRR